MHKEKKYKPVYIVLAGLFGVITTLISYYGYGVSDHVEQLPLIFRNIDKHYLVNDFFINSGEHSVARLVYCKLMAFIAGEKENLPFVFYLFTMLSNTVISIITFFFAKKLYNNSDTAGIFASAAVMTVTTFNLGWNDTIYSTILVPSSIALPILLGALWAIAERKLLLGILLGLTGTIIHPLMGLETSFLLFITFIARITFAKDEQLKQYRMQIFISALCLLSFFLFFLYHEYKEGHINAERFIYILAYFRHPHHYLPSYFPVKDYLYGILFLLTGITAFLTQGEKNKRYAQMIIILVPVIILLCIGGYVFVEIMPSRTWTTAQTFRLLYIVKWLGLVIIAGAISTYKISRFKQLLYMGALLHPYTLVVVTSLKALAEKSGQYNSKSRIIDIAILVVLAITILCLQFPVTYVLHFAFYLLYIAAAVGYHRFVFRRFLPYMLLIGVAVYLTKDHFYYSYKYIYLGAQEVETRKKEYDLISELDIEGNEIIAYVQQHTAKDAVFLVPPYWGQFRILADRAVVVDFKAFPFSDSAMKEWYDRIVNCYGASQSEVVSKDELENNYIATTDAKLGRLVQLYNISYAIYHIETPTRFDVIYSNESYKLVSLNSK